MTLINDISTFLNFGLATIQDVAKLVSGGDSFVKGIVTVSLLSFAAFLLKVMPRHIFSFVKKFFSTTIRYQKPGNEDQFGVKAFNANLEILAKLLNVKSFILEKSIQKETISEVKETNVLLPGVLMGFFFKNKKLFIVNRYFTSGDKTSPGVNEIYITSIFGNKDDILNLFPKFELENKRFYYDLSRWDAGADSIQDTLLSDDVNIFIPTVLKTKIDSAIEYFLKNKKEMLDRGIPWKLTFFFYGEPGTGKSTLIKYAAKKLNMSIAANPGGYQPWRLLRAQSNNSVLALEDIDASDALRIRKTENVTSTRSSERLDELLNFLQGSVPLDGAVTAMTTNHIELLDPAIYRPGRVDLKLYVSYYDVSELKDFTNFFYRELFIESEFPAFSNELKFRPADLADIYKRNPKNIQGFYKEVKSLDIVTQINDSV